MNQRQRQPQQDVVSLLGVPLAMSNMFPTSFPSSTDRRTAIDRLIARSTEEDEDEEEEDEKEQEDNSEDEGDGYSE